jgi:hypothetical protein
VRSFFSRFFASGPCLAQISVGEEYEWPSGREVANSAWLVYKWVGEWATDGLSVTPWCAIGPFRQFRAPSRLSVSNCKIMNRPSLTAVRVVTSFTSTWACLYSGHARTHSHLQIFQEIYWNRYLSLSLSPSRAY